MKKKTLGMVLALTVAMGIVLTGCGKDAGGNTNAEKEATVSVEEKSQETESTEVVVETEGETNEDDYTYCNLLSDPYFDMDNAIKDEVATAAIQSENVMGADKELLYNIVDGDKYVEITGAESYDVNKNIEMDGTIYLYPNLAYYGIDPTPAASGTPNNEFQCMGDTLPYWDVNYSSYEVSLSNEEITIIKAYTIPKVDVADIAGGMPVVGYGIVSGTPALCEVEYNGEHYWTTIFSLEQALGELE